MNEHLTADECRNLAAIAKWPVRDINLGAMHRDWLRAAATIEALQRQLDDVIDTLENWVPSSECSVMEIAQARACGRMLVSTNNLGIVKRPNTQLAELAPASADTDEAREALDDLLHHAEGHLEGGYYDDDLFGKAAVEADRLCRPALDALDASRAECERLRGLLRQCEWAGYHDGHPSPPYQCPCCGNDRAEGHHPACPLLADLGAGQ